MERSKPLTESKPFFNPVILALAIGDAIFLILFSLIGRISHNMSLELSAILFTSLPFIAAWILIGMPFGIFRATQKPWSVIKRLALTTLISVPLAILLRQLMIGRPTDFSFVYASWAAVFSFILVWRLIFMWYHTKFGRSFK